MYKEKNRRVYREYVIEVVLILISSYLSRFNDGLGAFPLRDKVAM